MPNFAEIKAFESLGESESLLKIGLTLQIPAHVCKRSYYPVSVKPFTFNLNLPSHKLIELCPLLGVLWGQKL